MHECVDGEYQAFRAMDGAYIRKEFFGKYPELLKLVEHMSDDEIWALRRGGLDPLKVYNAYHRAMQHNGQPTVILAKTVKGYGLGEAAEGRMTAHQHKKIGDADLLKIRDRFKLPLSDEAVTHVDFYRPPEDSPEMRYLRQRIEAQGGPLPTRIVKPIEIKAPALETFKEALEGSRGREASTTSAFVAVLKSLLKSPELGKLIVPIIPDEARTFGMESLFREYGIYASQGQRYKPVDSNVLLYYKEAQNGQILEEGITEAGSMASCIAAGTAYANYGVPMIPFYIYYSMFGYQRVGDLVWAFADSRGKGFLMGGTSGRTTLLGRGIAASGRPQSAAVQRGSHLRGLRSGLRVRAGRDHPGRHPAHVSGDGRPLLLHLRLQRKLRAAADARHRAWRLAGIARRHSEGHLQVPRGGEWSGGRAVVRQRFDSERGAEGAADSGGALSGRDRRVVGDQLQRTAPRRPGGGSLEPSASHRGAAGAAHREAV